VATRLKRAAPAPPTRAVSPTVGRLAAAAAIAVVLAANLALTWGRWGDIVTDVGRELDTALQLSQGRRLYTDVRSYYGPLAPYVNAALFRLFGARVGVLAAAGVVTGALLSIVAYRSVRLFAGRPVAAATAVAVLQAGVFV
jgi:predicted membrane-bound mannosyltransferase